MEDSGEERAKQILEIITETAPYIHTLIIHYVPSDRLYKDPSESDEEIMEILDYGMSDEKKNKSISINNSLKLLEEKITEILTNDEGALIKRINFNGGVFDFYRHNEDLDVWE
jgi:hypothetical protein